MFNFVDCFYLIKGDKIALRAFVVVIILNFIIALSFSVSAALISSFCYVLGILISFLCIKYRNITSSVLRSVIIFFGNHVPNKKSIIHFCGVCDDLACKRSRQTNIWKNLLVKKEVDMAVEKFFNKIMEEFVSSWYEKFTNDCDFINQLRSSLRHSLSCVVYRFLEIHPANIISYKLLPCTVKHIDDYSYMRPISKFKNLRFKKVAVEYLGKRLHIAATNRNNEIWYLREITSSLLPFILPEHLLKCRNYSVFAREVLAGWVFLPLMDAISDPYIINSLVIYAVKNSSKKSNFIKFMEELSFLSNFCKPTCERVSLLSTSLKEIIGNTQLFYIFMQFLKKEEQVHLLQFCLDIDDLNKKILTLSLDRKLLENLHSEVVTFHKEYLTKNNVHYVHCPSEISEKIGNILKNGSQHIYKLKSTNLLNKAYEHISKILELNYLPNFFHSNEFYCYLCGPKFSASYNKSALTRAKSYDPNSQCLSFKLNSLERLKGALKTDQPVEGALESAECRLIENATIEDILNEYGSISRDLSSWRITICSYIDLNKVIFFHISVERLDLTSGESKSRWYVRRRDQDFYTLKAKLIEFHGENEIYHSPLPTRKAGSAIETRMVKYQDFLCQLLAKPLLRRSDLLYTFLTSEEDFSMYISTGGAPLQDIGNVYQSVAHKLRKEKGQYLDIFMTTFLTSVEGSKTGKVEFAEMGDEIVSSSSSTTPKSVIPKTYRNSTFNDNFGVNYKVLKDTSTNSVNPTGIIESLFYILKHIFKISHIFLGLFAATSSIAYEVVDRICKLIIARQIEKYLNECNIVYVVKQLEDVLFNSSHALNIGSEEKRIKSFNEVKHLVSSEGLISLLEIFQDPHYNKQLSYHLFDIILLEMYPVLNKEKV